MYRFVIFCQLQFNVTGIFRISLFHKTSSFIRLLSQLTQIRCANLWSHCKCIRPVFFVVVVVYLTLFFPFMYSTDVGRVGLVLLCLSLSLSCHSNHPFRSYSQCGLFIFSQIKCTNVVVEKPNWIRRSYLDIIIFNVC